MTNLFFYIPAILDAVVCSLVKVSARHRFQMPFLSYNKRDPAVPGFRGIRS